MVTRSKINENENIHGKLEIAVIENKLHETRLSWFGHVQKRATDVIVRKIDCSECTRTL